MHGGPFKGHHGRWGETRNVWGSQTFPITVLISSSIFIYFIHSGSIKNFIWRATLLLKMFKTHSLYAELMVVPIKYYIYKILYIFIWYYIHIGVLYTYAILYTYILYYICIYGLLYRDRRSYPVYIVWFSIHHCNC